MRKDDVIVIGGGFAGLIAAAASAKRGKKVTLLSFGMGTLTVGSGIVDILGYNNDGTAALTPEVAVKMVDDDHPYHKIGFQAVKESVEFFLELCREEMYPYIGSLNEMKWIPTAAGTLKPTCLVPKTIDVARLKEIDTIYIVGFHCLKDYYAGLVAKNLKTSLGSDKKYEVVMINHQFSGGRDVTVLDLARWLDTEAGRAEFIKELKIKIKPGSVALIPPILGTAPDYLVLDAVKKATGCHFIETVTVPPSISGLRLRSMLINRLKKMGVRMIEKANVMQSILEDGKCVGVVTDGIDRERSYYAQSFILATGGFYGGGLISSELGEVDEPIFKIPIQIPVAQEKWSNLNLFSNEKQPFAKIGITIDEKMRPLDEKGNLLFENVFIAGRNLQGYDFCFEKSGNGVALTSGYQAAMSV